MTSNDTETNGARFGCGFVFGLVFGAFSFFGSAFALGYFEVFIVLGVAIVCGFAAMKFGDRFWRWVGNWFP